MSKLRATTAVAALSLLAACNETYVATTQAPKTRPIQTTQESQPNPWMQVMQRFGVLKPAGGAEAHLEKRLLEIARAHASAPSGRLQQGLVASGDGDPQLGSADPKSALRPLQDSVIVREARKLGSKLTRVFAGPASFYSLPGKVASGGKFVPEGMTAAHRTLPFGTKLRVTDPKSGRSVVVVVNDRGPYINGRVLDLSLGAARVLGMTSRGVIQVRAEVI
jgi:rare lipoprotein A (peptidoglycan hydrolase)